MPMEKLPINFLADTEQSLQRQPKRTKRSKRSKKEKRRSRKHSTSSSSNSSSSSSSSSVPSPTIVKMVPIPTVATTSKATPTPRKKDTKGTQTEIRGCEVGTLGEILTLLRQNQGLSFTDIPRAPQHCQCQYCGKFGHTASVCRTRLRLGQ